MKKLKVMAVAVAAVLMIPALAGQGASADVRVLGESLDSGLGELSASYTAAEYNTQGWVRGESMDSGLGELSASYTAAEFLPADRVVGEKLDSGLGELTRADLMRLVAAASRK